MRRSLLGPLVALSMVSTTALADETPWKTPFYDEGTDRFGWAVPDYARLGAGGFLGTLVLDIGYAIARDIVDIGVSFGWDPAHGGAPRYESITLHGSVRPLHLLLSERFLLVPLYVGGGGMRTFGPDLFAKQPGVYPAGYYPPEALHAMVFFGAELDLLVPESVVKRHGIFWEAVTIDHYLGEWRRNQSIGATDVFSSYVGYRARF